MPHSNLKNLNILGLVCARAGSKGLPGKNIRLLADKPLLAHAITTGIDSEYVTRVVCTTDGPKIAKIASQWGAEVPFIRPAELATDDVSDAPFTKHAIEWLRDNEGWTADIVVILRPTCPLTRSSDIDKALEKLESHPSAHSILGVVEAPKTPYKMLREMKDGYLAPLLTCTVPDQLNVARQLLPPVLAQTGYIHIVRSDIVLRDNTAVGSKILPYHMENEAIVDIDSESDFQSVEELISTGIDTHN